MTPKDMRRQHTPAPMVFLHNHLLNLYLILERCQKLKLILNWKKSVTS